MPSHETRVSPRMLHGAFDHNLTPIARIESGDRLIAVGIPDAGWHQIEQADPYEAHLKLEDVPEEQRTGHALHGPFFVNGAEPGDALEIQLHAIEPSSWGWTAAGGWPCEFNERLGLVGKEHFRMGWRIADGKATDANGLNVSLSPFLGWIGLMPAAEGLHSTTPPRRVGGNIDCRELVAGTRLFLPVEVAGGLLSFGDGHAVQGDGEVAGPALECPMARVEMSVHLRKGAAPVLPYADTPAGWVALGFAPNLDNAMYDALESLVRRVEVALKVSRQEALTLCSMKASLRVTQIVNEVKGVHALLPTAALEEFGLC